MSTKDDFINWVTKHLHVPELAVEVGFLKSATYANEDDESDVKYVAQVAYDNNYGNKVPARPFFTNVVEGSKDYQKEFENYLNMGFPVDKSLDLIGTELKQDIQKEIIDLREPPNSPTTIAKKGSSNPLVDTGHMGDSVTYVIKGTQ